MKTFIYLCFALCQVAYALPKDEVFWVEVTRPFAPEGTKWDFKFSHENQITVFYYIGSIQDDPEIILRKELKEENFKKIKEKVISLLKIEKVLDTESSPKSDNLMFHQIEFGYRSGKNWMTRNFNDVGEWKDFDPEAFELLRELNGLLETNKLKLESGAGGNS